MSIYSFQRLKSVILISSALLYYFIGIIGFLSYLIASFDLFRRKSLFDWYLLILIFSILLIAILKSDPITGLSAFRFHYGFFLFFYFFSYSRVGFNTENIYKLLIVMVLAEAVLIHGVGYPAHLLPNYPDLEARSHFGEWQRVYSFGGNASVTGALMAMLLSVSIFNLSKNILHVSAFYFIASGSGLLAYLMLLFFRLRIYLILIISALIMLFIASSFFGLYELFTGSGNPILNKVTFLYIDYLWVDKSTRVAQAINSSSLDAIIFGNPTTIYLGGDFSFLNFFINHGLFGIFVFLMFVGSKINRKNFIGVSIGLITLLHYQVIFSLPGQLIFGYLLSLKDTNDGFFYQEQNLKRA